MVTENEQLVTSSQPPEPGEPKIFRLKPDENEGLMNVMIPLAHKLGCISQPSLQKYMIFSLNCALERLKAVYKERNE